MNKITEIRDRMSFTVPSPEPLQSSSIPYGNITAPRITRISSIVFIRRNCQKEVLGKKA